MEQKDLAKYFKCPLTGLIFCEPVLAEDGHFYELMSIKNYLIKNETSPITKQKMGTLIIHSQVMKNMVEEFLLKNPEYKNEQFLSKKPFFLFSKEFIESLKEKRFDDLMKYTTILLNMDLGKETLFEAVCKLCPDNVIKHIIDNSIDYDTFDKRKNLKPLHIVCKYASHDVILHLMNKNVDLQSQDLNGETALSYLILYRTKDFYFNVIADFIATGFNLDSTNKEGLSAANYLINNGDLDTLKLLIDNGLNIGTPNKKIGNMNLLQYAFKESRSDALSNFLIDLDINLDIDIDPKTTCEQLIYSNNHLDKKQKQHLVLYYLTKIFKKPVIVDNFIC